MLANFDLLADFWYALTLTDQHIRLPELGHDLGAGRGQLRIMVLEWRELWFIGV